MNRATESKSRRVKLQGEWLFLPSASAHGLSLPTFTFGWPWFSFDVSRDESGADTGLGQSLAPAEKRCASNSHFRSRTRSRLIPCSSDFLPAAGELSRPEDAPRISRARFSFLS